VDARFNSSFHDFVGVIINLETPLPDSLLSLCIGGVEILKRVKHHDFTELRNLAVEVNFHAAHLNDCFQVLELPRLLLGHLRLWPEPSFKESLHLNFVVH